MYDVIVLGGGVIGASAAYHLTQAGARTLLVDRGDVGRATDAGAGIISPETNTRDPEDWFGMAVEAAAYYPQLVEALDAAEAGPTGYARCGLLLVAVTEDEILPFEQAKARIYERQRRRGLPAAEDLHEVSPGEARHLFPPLANVEWAIFYRGAARVDGRLLAQAMRRAAERAGLATRAATAESLVMDGNRVAGVMVEGERVSAPRVIICGGAWSSAFGDQLELQLPVAPQRGQIIHLQVEGEDTAQWPIVNAFRGHYLLGWPEGRVVAGATREFGTGFDPRVTAGGLHEILREALRVAPGLVDATVGEIRVGLRPVSADGMPVLGPVPQVEGVYLATGHGPTGLTVGPFTAKAVADLALTGQSPIDLTPFSVTRFEHE